MLHILASKTDFDKLIGFNKKNYLKQNKIFRIFKNTKQYNNKRLYIYIKFILQVMMDFKKRYLSTNT